MSNARTAHFDMPVRSRTSRAQTVKVDYSVAPTISRSRAKARVAISPVALTLTLVVVLGVVYIALIAVVMSYAALTVTFFQSVRDDEAKVAALESRYLERVSAVTATDYAAEGYERPAKEVFVPKAAATALR